MRYKSLLYKFTMTLIIGGLLLLLPACSKQKPPEEFDIIIKDTLLIDGTGTPGRRTDIGIKGERIQHIGQIEGEAGIVIEAKGRVTSPGFIDMMGQGSYPLVADRASAESKLRQGITTLLVGEGVSMAPMNEEIARYLEIEPEWTTFAEYFQFLEDNKIALNVIHNVGAALVRAYVLGDKDVDPTPEQLKEMKALVDQGMKDGCVGISTALIYPPGSYAKTEELIELAKVVSKYGGVYQSHVRNESSRLLQAIEEALRIGREAELPVHIYHLKAAGEENWPLMGEALQKIADARNEGLEVTADIYPYIRNGIGLESFIHPRHYAGGRDVFLSTLKDPIVREGLRREIESTSDWENWYRHVGRDWNNVLISDLGKNSDPQIAGLSIQEVAQKRSQDAWDVFFDLVTEEVGVNPKSMNEEQKQQALRAPFVCLDTDAAPVNPEKVASVHPRAFGAFARVIAKYVREEKVISLEEAIQRMAALPAGILKIKNRGLVAPGYYADLLIFDPKKVKDKATFTQPLQYSEGFDYVIINGALVIDSGQMTEALPGKVLRHRP